VLALARLLKQTDPKAVFRFTRGLRGCKSGQRDDSMGSWCAAGGFHRGVGPRPDVIWSR
jgi:hypothetical protein